MANSDPVSAILNPVTPLDLLPLALAEQYQTAFYVVVAGFSAFVWDWTTSIAEEYEIISGSGRLNVPLVTYVFSRIGTAGYLVCTLMFEVASVKHCQAVLYILGSFSILGMCSTSLLFFYRVRAVYGQSKIITFVFGFLWMALFGMSFVLPLAPYGSHIGPTERCIITYQRSYTFMPIIANAIYDTLVFLAISHRIVSYTVIGDNWRARAKSFLTADGLPRLSRALLQSGQQYYFATIGLSISLAVMLLIPGVPAVSRVMLTVPTLALANAMGCRVYRAVMLGLIQDPPSTHLVTTIRFKIPPRQSGEDASSEQATFVESLV